MCEIQHNHLINHFSILSVILLPETVQTKKLKQTMFFFQWYNRFHALVAHLALLSKTTPSYDVITPRHTFFMINASHYLKKLSLSFQFKIKLERSCLKNCLRTCKRLAHQFLLKSTFCLTLPSEKHFTDVGEEVAFEHGPISVCSPVQPNCLYAEVEAGW